MEAVKRFRKEKKKNEKYYRCHSHVAFVAIIKVQQNGFSFRLSRIRIIDSSGSPAASLLVEKRGTLFRAAFSFCSFRLREISTNVCRYASKLYKSRDVSVPCDTFLHLLTYLHTAFLHLLRAFRSISSLVDLRAHCTIS